jgi:hypothetical protein
MSTNIIYENQIFNNNITISTYDIVEFRNCVFNNSIIIDISNFIKFVIYECQFLNKVGNIGFTLKLASKENIQSPEISIISYLNKIDLSDGIIGIASKTSSLFGYTDYLLNARFRNINFDRARFVNYNTLKGCFLSGYKYFNDKTLSFNQTDFTGATFNNSNFGTIETTINGKNFILTDALLYNTTCIPINDSFPCFFGIPKYNDKSMVIGDKYLFRPLNNLITFKQLEIHTYCFQVVPNDIIYQKFNHFDVQLQTPLVQNITKQIIFDRNNPN